MTYSQPQQQQAPYRPNRAALWVNSRKSAANQPDYKGNLEISWALLQELTAAFNSGQYAQDSGGQPCIKLDLALYAQQGGVSASGKARPILSGQLSTVAETAQSAAMRQQAAAQYQQQVPQGYAPQPQYQPQYQPQQPAPMPQSAPEQPQYAPAPAPQPMPQAAPQPAYQQPPMPQAPAPVAPPAPTQPMPGAIHGQPPAGPAPVLPQGF
jgi:hypothetical protein